MGASLIIIQDRQAQLDDLLSLWHWWASKAKTVRGHADRSLVVGDYLTSRQYDDVSGKLDDDLDKRRARAVQFAVEQIPDPWRTAIYVVARNIYLGHAVFISARLPDDKQDREIVIARARLMLIERLIHAGVIE